MDGVKNITIGISEGDYAWTGSAEIVDIAQYRRLAVGDAVSVSLGGEVFSLLISQKNMARDNDPLPKMTVSLISPTAELASPMAETLDIKWDSPITAKNAGEQVAGQSITWTMVDWLIPGGRLVFTATRPITVLQAIAKAAGGVIETTPAGALTMRPRFPVSVPDWADAAVDFTLTDSEHNFSVTEAMAYIVRGNRVSVRGDLAAATDAHLSGEVDGENPIYGGETATLRVFTGPRVQDVEVFPTAGTVSGGTRGTYAKVEDIHFRDSMRETLSVPASSITSVAWLGTDLGTITLDPLDGQVITLVAAGTSIARVTLATEPLIFTISVPYVLAGTVTEYPVDVLLTAKRSDGADNTDEIYVRGEGEFLIPDISDPLLTSPLVRRARAFSEIDAGEALQAVSLECIHIPGIRLGHLIEVQDSYAGDSWRGKVVGISHKATIPTMRTSLKVLKYVL